MHPTDNRTANKVEPEPSADSVSLGYPRMEPTPPQYGSADFTQSPSATTAAKSSSPPKPSAPLPTRPRGRTFIGALMLAVFGGFAYCLYEGYVRYAAYGEVVGRKIELAPPWDGVVSALHVRVGDVIRQGDVVFHVESMEMRHRMEEIEDSLNLERARLGSELARLKWEAERITDTEQLVKADFYEKWSELLWEQSVLTDLKQQHSRAEQMRLEGAVAVEKLDSLKNRVAGQQQRITQLSEAVDSLKRRVEFGDAKHGPVDSSLNDQIRPALVRIENLQAELRRVRQRLDQGLVRCPANGLVTRIMKFSGEHANGTESVIELLVDGSTEIVIYVPQARSKDWSQGDQLDVFIEPENRGLHCEVAQVAPEMRAAPPLIMRHYAADEVLLPIVLRPLDSAQARQLVLGSKVRLPRRSPLSQAYSVSPQRPVSSQSPVSPRTVSPRTVSPRTVSPRTVSSQIRAIAGRTQSSSQVVSADVISIDDGQPKQPLETTFSQ